ncbi:MAG: hypothetical protein DCF25_22185 [Leptolyngbya foveolarum]|uniref:Uncharacterized protein n=1 Tax=Leptolyngbya foveolarum TaxID=47253 RepID=A0A2W4VMX0_9CYAN|nr:MAG: hypothetical protein DCF25_22185 [Leptolyngbya foveolarum]
MVHLPSEFGLLCFLYFSDRPELKESSCTGVSDHTLSHKSFTASRIKICQNEDGFAASFV